MEKINKLNVSGQEFELVDATAQKEIEELKKIIEELKNGGAGSNIYQHDLSWNFNGREYRFEMLTNFAEPLSLASICNLLKQYYSFSYGDICVHNHGVEGEHTHLKFNFIKGHYPGSNSIYFEINLSGSEENATDIVINSDGTYSVTDLSDNDITANYEFYLTDSVKKF